VSDILAIEALTAAQGLDLHAPLKPSVPLLKVHGKLRGLSPSMPSDRSLHRDIQSVSGWIKSGGAIEVIG
jgi:histidine ammonia-lyase